jgi:hypothetical protein
MEASGIAKSTANSSVQQRQYRRKADMTIYRLRHIGFRNEHRKRGRRGEKEREEEQLPKATAVENIYPSAQ